MLGKHALHCQPSARASLTHDKLLLLERTQVDVATTGKRMVRRADDAKRIGGERRRDAFNLTRNPTHHDQIDFVPDEQLQDRFAIVNAQSDLDSWKLLAESH